MYIISEADPSDDLRAVKIGYFGSDPHDRLKWIQETSKRNLQLVYAVETNFKCLLEATVQACLDPLRKSDLSFGLDGYTELYEVSIDEAREVILRAAKAIAEERHLSLEDDVLLGFEDYYEMELDRYTDSTSALVSDLFIFVPMPITGRSLTRSVAADPLSTRATDTQSHLLTQPPAYFTNTASGTSNTRSIRSTPLRRAARTRASTRSPHLPSSTATNPTFRYARVLVCRIARIVAKILPKLLSQLVRPLAKATLVRPTTHFPCADSRGVNHLA